MMGIRWRRIAALGIDLYILIFSITSVLFIINRGEKTMPLWMAIVNVILFSLGCLFKDCVFCNGSVGKKIVRLKIVKNDGGPVRTVDRIIRSLGAILTYPVYMILILVAGKHLGDVWSKTEVVPGNACQGDG